MIRQIGVHQVKAGMFIQGFGGSWFKHPFWSSKFLLTSPEDVEKVRQSGVPYVLIDISLGMAPDDMAMHSPGRAVPGSALTASRYAPEPEASPPENKRDAERRDAQALVTRSKKVVMRIFNGARLGRAVRVAEVVDIVDEVTESVARSPHALLNVTRLKTKDEYTYLHSVAVCTLMVNLARHMGMDAAQVRDLGLAGLLHDIGKMGVPEMVLNKPGRLTDEEFAMVREHPSHGHRMLAEADDMVDVALDVCLHHHEKMDGTGYPFRMPGERISVAARMGAICDVYDALTSDRIYKEAWTPAEAIAAMWSWEGHFDPRILFAFMQSIGVFPVGMLVQLRSNRLGIVMENAKRASRPRVCAFYATRDREFLDPEIVVIKDSLAADQIMSHENPGHWGFADWDGMSEWLLQGKMPPKAA